MNIFKTLLFSFFLVGNAYADENVLAKNIGFCEATNKVYIEIAKKSNKIAILQIVQNQALEAAVPDVLAEFPSIDSKNFYHIKKETYDDRTAQLVTEMKKTGTIDKEKFSIDLAFSVADCLEMFPPPSGETI